MLVGAAAVASWFGERMQAVQERKAPCLVPCMHGMASRIHDPWLSPAGPVAVDRVALLPMRRQVWPPRFNKTVVRVPLRFGMIA